MSDGSSNDSTDSGESYPHRTTAQATYTDERKARAVAAAVGVETGAIDDERSTARLARDGRTVRLTIRARDTNALRAGLNTWLRLLRAAEDSVTAATE